jgi:hypothetical protein
MARDGYDPKGERGGDTGKTDQKGAGPGAEKGDQRRDTPIHSGPSRPGAQGADAEHDRRSGSECGSCPTVRRGLAS